jgi:hypothetical protein
LSAKRFEVGKRALLKRKETIMNDLRVLTDAELDIVAGGSLPVMSNGCNTGTTYYATSRTTSCGCGENLLQELVADIFKILEGNNCGGGVQKRM